MLIYYIAGFILVLSVIITGLVRLYTLRKKSAFIKLFNEALRQENNGDFETALVNYRQALVEADRMRFDYGFRSKIVEKLKTLQTVIDYGNSISHRNFPASYVADREAGGVHS